LNRFCGPPDEQEVDQVARITLLDGRPHHDGKGQTLSSAVCWRGGEAFAAWEYVASEHWQPAGTSEGPHRLLTTFASGS
jgi:hypothetical protein